MRYHAFLATLLMVLSLPSSAAEPAAGDITALVTRYFPDGKVTGGTRANFPSYLVADFNGDGEDDLAVAIEDAETARRGQGCYALAIFNSFPHRSSARHSTVPDIRVLQGLQRRRYGYD